MEKLTINGDFPQIFLQVLQSMQRGDDWHVKIQYQWPFSIAMLVYQRVVQWGCTIWLFYGIFMGFNLTVVFCFKFCELGIYVFIPMVKIEGLGTIAFVDFKY